MPSAKFPFPGVWHRIDKRKSFVIARHYKNLRSLWAARLSALNGPSERPLPWWFYLSLRWRQCSSFTIQTFEIFRYFLKEAVQFYSLEKFCDSVPETYTKNSKLSKIAKCCKSKLYIVVEIESAPFWGLLYPSTKPTSVTDRKTCYWIEQLSATVIPTYFRCYPSYSN